MEILAIDQATKAGWYLNKDNHGVWNLTTKNGESMGMKLVRFRACLHDIHEEFGLGIIVYERVAGRFANALIHSAKMVGVIETFCEDNNIEFRAYSASEIKKFATGKGNATKQQMIDSCTDKYGFTPIDDNEADAAHLWHLAKHDLKL